MNTDRSSVAVLARTEQAARPFLSFFPPSARRLVRRVFHQAAREQCTPEGVVRAVHEQAQAALSCPGVYAHLSAWKRLLFAIGDHPAEARRYAARLLEASRAVR